MTPLTGSGSEAGEISISSCLKCEKVIFLVDQLTKNMHDFEIVTMEMEFEFDLKLAKSKSEKVLSDFWQLISMIKSIKFTDEKEESGKDLDENPNPTSSNLKGRSEKHGLQSANGNKPTKYKLKKVEKTKSNPNPNMTEKRRNELQRANRLLRTIKCETLEGFYNLFECIKCQKQFNDIGNARRHVKVGHLGLGTDKCPTCGNPYFDKKLLQLHIPKCSQKTQLDQIKVWLRNDREKLVKVQLLPHQNQNQNQVRATRNQNSGRKIQNHGAEKKSQNLCFDLSRLKVRNPFEKFSIVKAMNVKVRIQRLDMEKTHEIASKSQTEIRATDEIETETGKKASLSQAAENEKCDKLLSCDEN